MLLEMALADAYGIAFEFVDPRDWEGYGLANTLDRFYQHPEYAALKPGQYTDDTQRAIANVNVMQAGQQYNGQEYASEYLRVLREDPRDGYSRRYQRFLETTPDSTTFIRTVRRGSANGSLMGVAPLGYLPSPGEVAFAAGIQAFTTHSLATLPYAMGVALAAHYFIYKLGPNRGLKRDLLEFLHREIPDLEHPRSAADLSPKVAAMSARGTFYAMLEGLEKHDNLADIIRWAVDRGGDTDSVAATTVAVASCSDEFTSNIPQVLYDGLEDHAFGLNYLRRKDSALKLRFTDSV